MTGDITAVATALARVCRAGIHVPRTATLVALVAAETIHAAALYSEPFARQAIYAVLGFMFLTYGAVTYFLEARRRIYELIDSDAEVTDGAD